MGILCGNQRGACLRGINLSPYRGTGKKEDYPCQYFKFAVKRDWLSQGNRKEIQSLSLLGHWLKSCLFQQWPKLITIQACCSVTNSMWKELVASEAGAHCWQSQQKDQGFGWILNMNFSSARGISPCPAVSQVLLPPVLFGFPGPPLGSARCRVWAWSPRPTSLLLPPRLPSHHSLATLLMGPCGWSTAITTPVILQNLPFIQASPWVWARKSDLPTGSDPQARIAPVSGGPQDRRDDFMYLWHKKRIDAPQIKTV